jgi:hypothetical protein
MAIASLFFAASSCSDDLDEDNGIQTEQTGDETAYLSVSLCPTSDTRAAQEFVAGSKAEQHITTADFYFFFADGTFSSHRKVYNSTEPAFNGSREDDDANQNVEFSGSVILTLKNLSTSNYPTMLVTILNQPDDFAEPKNIQSLTEEIEGEAMNATASDLWKSYRKSSSGDFIMTTSTFPQDNQVGSNYYNFVTLLKPSDYKATQAEAVAAAADPAKSVSVYVERLAAKVNVQLSEDLTNKETITVTDANNGKQYPAYRIGDTSDGKDPMLNVDGTPTKLYAEIISWGMDAQMPVSYYMKRIDDAKTTWGAESDFSNGLNFTWYETKNHRSYWAKSYNYGKYGTSYTGSDKYTYPIIYQTNLSETKTESDPLQLVYLSANQLTTDIASSGYCAENTNTADVLNTVRNYKGAVTSALIKAYLVDEKGNHLTVINLGGDLYTEKGYATHVYQQLGVHYYTTKSDEGALSGEMEPDDDLEIVKSANLNGQIQVALNTESQAAQNQQWYDADGNAVTHDEINAKFASYQGSSSNNGEETTDSNEAVYYKDGLMYYCIPIRHLRNADQTYTDKTIREHFLEGIYGVVRNHLYAITVNDILNIGHGVYDPDEPIVPPIEVTENFYLGVNINILSWYNVSQNITL